MSVAQIERYEQPTLGEMFGRPVERLQYQLKDIGAAMKDIGGARLLEFDETVTLTIQARVTGLGAMQSQVADQVVRLHLLEVIEVELGPEVQE